jgi:hypothetical protein
LGARLRLPVWISNGFHQTADDLLVVELAITNLVSAEAAAWPRSSCSRREDAARETIWA